MARRTTPLVTNEIYHIFNRGVEKREIFLDRRDYQRFINVTWYYTVPEVSKYSLSSSTSGNTPRGWKTGGVRKKVEIICYCLMPNHYHFLLRQEETSGVSSFISLIQNSYTRYFNTKYKRIGPLFQGPFKAVRVETEEQLLHLSRYIHLNPFVADLVKNPEAYQWSSLEDYFGSKEREVSTEIVLSHFNKSKGGYRKFVIDHADYAKALEKIKHQAIDL